MIKESTIGSSIQFPGKAIAFPDALAVNTQGKDEGDGEDGEKVKRENAPELS
ncbi:MAG: hypothetical protein RIM23_15600 [Coleofasciculus sp. G3-WIS-01]|uniref:hypothetical protein n=1 Tax=Coleofasciculus sp. G3-WIS-01 TaxID=3069528 RepID=UPI0032FA1773